MDIDSGTFSLYPVDVRLFLALWLMQVFPCPGHGLPRRGHEFSAQQPHAHRIPPSVALKIQACNCTGMDRNPRTYSLSQVAGLADHKWMV